MLRIAENKELLVTYSMPEITEMLEILHPVYCGSTESTFSNVRTVCTFKLIRNFLHFFNFLKKDQVKTEAAEGVMRDERSVGGILKSNRIFSLREIRIRGYTAAGCQYYRSTLLIEITYRV